MTFEDCIFLVHHIILGRRTLLYKYRLLSTIRVTGIFVGIKINYHLLTSIYVTSILSYTVLEDDANDEK